MPSNPLLSIRNRKPGGSPRYLIISGFNSVKCLMQYGLKKLGSSEKLSPDQMYHPVVPFSMECLNPLIGIKSVRTLSAIPILNSKSGSTHSMLNFSQMSCWSLKCCSQVFCMDFCFFSMTHNILRLCVRATFIRIVYLVF